MSGDLVWSRDGRDWPNREASSFVRASGLTWHVQRIGEGPVLLLVHGMGATTHSWRDLAPVLARRFTVVAADLPGHGFTSRPSIRRLSVEGMAGDLAGLIDTLGLQPDIAVGHSAGAAILCRMTLDARIAPKGIVSLNGALQAFRGLAGHIFSPLAKFLAWSPAAAHLLVATMSGRSSVERLLDETGSRIDERGIRLYHRVVQSPSHVGSALGMMAGWRLEELERDLPRLAVPLLLVAGGKDRSIPPASAHRVRAAVPRATVDERPGLGHLLHEEKPEIAAGIIEAFAASLHLSEPDGAAAEKSLREAGAPD